MKDIFLYVMGVTYILAGLNHFKNPKVYLSMMPPLIPAPHFMIYLSGGIEVFLGLAVMWPPTTWLAAWGIMALLLALLLPHIYMIQKKEQWPKIPLWLLWLRLPLQGLLILWAYSYT